MTLRPALCCLCCSLLHCWNFCRCYEEALASQLRCVRGVSQEIAKRLVKGHNHMQSFITAMMAAEDPVILISNAKLSLNIRLYSLISYFTLIIFNCLHTGTNIKTIHMIHARQWLVQKGSHKESRWSRPAAALLAEALAGQAAVERENLICSFQARRLSCEAA